MISQRTIHILKVAGLVTIFSLPIVALAQQDVNSGLSGLRILFGNTANLDRGQGVFGLISWVIRVLLIFSGIIAVIMVLISGFNYMTAGGNQEAATKARLGVVNSLIGLVIVILAYVIVNAVSKTLLNGSLR